MAQGKTKVVGQRGNAFTTLMQTWGAHTGFDTYKILLCQDNVLVLRRKDNYEDTFITVIRTSDKCYRITRAGASMVERDVTYANYSTARDCYELARRLEVYACEGKWYDGRTFKETLQDRRKRLN